MIKGLSAKERVLVWYTLTLIIIISVIGSLFYIISNKTVLDNAKHSLETIVDEAMEDIRIVDGEIIISDNIEYSKDGVTIALFDGSGKDLSGLLPDDLPRDTEFIPDVIRRLENGKIPRYVYDRLIENERTGEIWVRGTISARISDNDPSFASIVKLSLILFPLLFFIALLGGMFIANRTFRPLKLITDTAQEISQGSDLSKRINVGDPDSEDEILRAAGVFDVMLDNVEESFENEKNFTNNASHELRTPTAVIMSQSEYALGSLDNKDEVKASLNVINQESHKMDGIVSELLLLARADRGALELNREKTDISLLAEETAAMNMDKAEERGMKISVDAREGIYLDADQTLFRMVYNNLITNAIKYGKDGGNICITVWEDDETITISVKDDGEGIAPEDAAHIFERFYRADKSKADGVGLGLPLVKLIVDQHGGNIELISSPGNGAEFRMEFKKSEL